MPSISGHSPRYARARVQLELWDLGLANNKVTTTVENLSVESPFRAPLSSTERSRLHRARKRAAKETRQGVPTALTEVSSPPTAPEAVAPLTKPASAFSNAVALVATVGLASVAAFFSVTGMVEVFPGCVYRKPYPSLLSDRIG
jgi:hypothetical protein